MGFVTSPVSQLLIDWRSGDREALDRLIPLVHAELHRMAAECLRGERPGHTLQPTALVNEAYLRLIGANVAWQDRAHFFAVAATTMRRVLVDHARAHGRLKRAGRPVSLEDSIIIAPGRADDFLIVDDALDRLTAQDARAARVIELHYFGGLTYEETAEALGISAATVDRDLRFARAWLHRELVEAADE
ncbi:MAG: sigma-70 family RNA polymerase sigma factor [Gemmatimonadaceae bacterium]|nr:sigma-70 family RNA polymerase sigma factor [Gemmatimonadaceae bacterium]